MEKVTVGGKYQHFKGTEYQVLAVAKDSETLKEMVVYQDIKNPEKVWIRPLAMFLDEVDRPELHYKGPRFTLLG